MSVEHPTATDLWAARTAVSITVAQSHRQQADADRELVESLTAAFKIVRAECEGLHAALTRVEGERDRARDLAVRAGAFDGCPGCAEREIEREYLIDERDRAIYERDELSLTAARLSVKVDTLTAERDAVESAISLAIYERDAAQAAADSSRSEFGSD